MSHTHTLLQQVTQMMAATIATASTTLTAPATMIARLQSTTG